MLLAQVLHKARTEVTTKNGRNTGGTQTGLGKRLAESNKSAAKSSYFKN